MAVVEMPQQEAMSVWAESIYKQKYAHPGEVWPDTAKRVATHVLGALGYAPDSFEVQKLTQLIADRKFLPGGRYLYASGRGLHQTQNCVLLRADDSREGWADVTHRSMMALMTGAGIGINYGLVRPKGTPIQKTGGTASGPISLMQIINEAGRHIMQGGSRRSAIWAGLPWWHADIFDFIKIKEWDQEIIDKKAVDFNHSAPLDMTNVSILLDDDFFYHFETQSRFSDNPAPDGGTWHDWAKRVYSMGVANMVRSAEPGFSVDIGDNAGEDLRNAPVTEGTLVMTAQGYRPVGDIVGEPVTIWTGQRWSDDVVFSLTQRDAPIKKVVMTGGRVIRCEPEHEFLVERWFGRGKRKQLDGLKRVKAGNLKVGDRLHVSLPHGVTPGRVDQEAYTLGYIYGDGSFHESGGVDLTLCTEESKLCAPALVGASSTNEHDGRGYTRMYFGVDDCWANRSKAEFPEDVYAMDFDGVRSFIAGLFDADGNYDSTQQRIRLASKHEGFLRGVGRALEQIGILSHVSKAGNSTYGKSQTYQLVVASEYTVDFAEDIPTQRLQPKVDDYYSYRPSMVKVLSVEDDGWEDVFCADVHAPEHSFMAEGVIISNCTEVTSCDDSDICNLGSINMSRIESLEEMEDIVEYAVLFLLAGTVYSHLPYDKIDEVRQQNRRLGLGLMGIHEWLLKRGLPYAPSDELGSYLEIYAGSTEISHRLADQHELSRPIKTRAIAPTGTIGIVGETTTGIEPIFCVAFKRRYLVDGTTWKYQYVIDPTAERLIKTTGISPGQIEDAYALSYDVEKRIAFQAWVQQYVDHAISSTINLPYPIVDPDEVQEFSDTLMRYLPYLRGITAYPDGARGGQPLSAVAYHRAHGQQGVVFEEDESKCKNGVCGS